MNFSYANCMTGLWIPEQFPYVAFNESGCDFSHISLWSFYRHIQLLTRGKLNSAFSQALMKVGACEEVLRRVFDIGRTLFYLEKVTKDTLK